MKRVIRFGSLQQYYLENHRCVMDSFEIQHDCMDQLVADVDSIRRNKDKDAWLASTCCFVDKWKKCFQKGAKKYCDEEGMKFLNWGADAYVSDLTDMACSAKLTIGSERCNELVAAILRPRNASAVAKPKSILLPLFHLLTEFADWEKVAGSEKKPAE